MARQPEGLSKQTRGYMNILRIAAFIIDTLGRVDKVDP